jgi:ABC-type transporter Mla subunit MlaD
LVNPLQREKSPEQPSISNNSQELIKENQELKQQLAEIQKKLAEVLAELKNLKGKNNDNLVSELTQTQEKNQQLISTGNISISQVQEQVKKSEALLNEVKSASFAPNSNEKENSVMPYVIGGSFILAISGILLGLLLLRKKNKT